MYYSDGGQDETAESRPKNSREIFHELKELEVQKKAALQLLGRKHKLGKLQNERDRARMMRGRWSCQELKVISPGLWTSSLWISAHFLWHKTQMMQCPRRLGLL